MRTERKSRTRGVTARASPAPMQQRNSDAHRRKKTSFPPPLPPPPQPSLFAPRSCVQPEKIKHLLDNVELGSGKAAVMEKIDGMKYLLAVSAAGGRRTLHSFPSPPPFPLTHPQPPLSTSPFPRPRR